MCGITGIYNTYGELVHRDLLENMVRQMIHRGPDEKGIFVDGNVGLGIRRLSIIDVAGGQQPRANEDGTIWVVCNGEIYNHRELKSSLKAKGHRYSSNSDIESIVHAYEEYGEACVHRLRGMFGFALWDSRRQKLLLIRDRLGIKPVYYWFRNGKLLFGSEIKPLLTHPDVKAVINPDAIYEYMILRYTIAPKTAFEGILKLPPGYVLTCADSKVTVKQYWDVKYGSSGEERQGESFNSDKLLALLKECISSHLMSEVPLGLFLSGGLDSATIVALMSEMVDKPIKTYTVGFGKGEPVDEIRYAREVSQYFGTDHHECICQYGSVELLEKIILYLEEPIADAAIIPTYLVSELASKDVKVILTGEGSDEVNGGYGKYLLNRNYENIILYYNKILPLSLRTAINRRQLLRTPALAKLYTLNAWSLSTAGKLLLMNHSFWRRLSEKELFTSDFLDGVANGNPFSAFLDNGTIRDTTDQFLYLDTKTWLANDLLLKVDKMSMAHSLEARVPYLDHKLVEFGATIPATLKLRKGVTKHLLRRAMTGVLPPEILSRKQHGFNVPTDDWFRGELKGWLRELLNDRVTVQRDYFRRDTIERVLRKYFQGDNDLSTLVWSLVVLELWHRSFIDKIIR